jgi:hypothetical protein
MRSVMTFSPLTRSSYHVYLYVCMYVCTTWCNIKCSGFPHRTVQTVYRYTGTCCWACQNKRRPLTSTALINRSVKHSNSRRWETDIPKYLLRNSDFNKNDRHVQVTDNSVWLAVVLMCSFCAGHSRRGGAAVSGLRSLIYWCTLSAAVNSISVKRTFISVTIH